MAQRMSNNSRDPRTGYSTSRQTAYGRPASGQQTRNNYGQQYQAPAQGNQQGYGDPAYAMGYAQAQGYDYGTQADPYGRGAAYGSGGGRPSNGKSGKRVLFIVIGLLIGLILGAALSFAVMSMRPSVPEPVAATLTQSQLDNVVGTYRYDGETFEITARQAILGTKSLTSVMNSDGTYDAPSADMVLSYARNQILAQLVSEKGITVTSEAVSAYALETVGTSDMALVASYYEMDADQALAIMTQAAAVKALRESVTAGSASTAPVAPIAPADGNTEVGTAAYADYIIGLLGAYWDSAAATWASTDNDYYRALQNQVFAPGSASYDAAQAAYAVAYAASQAAAGTSTSWTDYVNAYLDKAAIEIATLRA